MRFPHHKLMARTFDLFKRINFTPENGKLVTYRMSTDADRCLYNNISGPASLLNAGSIDKFRFSTKRGGTVPEEYVQRGYEHWIDLKIDWLKKELREDFEGKGWRDLMSVDNYSMRSFMATATPIKGSDSESDQPETPAYPNSVRTCMLLPYCFVVLIYR